MKNKHNILHYLITALTILLKNLAISIIWILITAAGCIIYSVHKTPFDIFLGIPLILIGGGFVINNLGSVILAFFYPSFNRGVCKLCNS